MAVLPKPPAVARVLQKVTAMARDHRMFESGGTVVVAVSGGPDSLCLLHSIVRLRRLFRIEPVCFHFDHRLREGSEEDAAYVRRQAARLGVPYVVRRASSKPGRGESVEAWARTVRYEALTAVVEELGGGVAAVGHTADDQAETILMALLQGSGLEGLAGMRPVALPIVRPLLRTTREETEAFCRSLRLRPRRDPMNEDLARMRVSIRKVLHTLEAGVGRNVREAIARSGAHLREDADLLESMRASRTLGRTVDDGFELDVEGLSQIPRPAAGRLVLKILYALGVRPEAEHVDAVLALLEDRPGKRIDLPGSLKAERQKGYVRLSRPSPRSGSR